MKEPLISISILTYNRIELLKELLFDLKKLSYNNIELIVVDNHSSDGTSMQVRSMYPNIRVIRSEMNRGAVGRNLGMAKARGDYIVTLDDDVFFKDSDAIERILSIFSEKEHVGVITFKVVHFYSNNVINWDHPYNKIIYSDREFITDSILEGASAFRKPVLDKTGYYPNSFFLSHEGTDLACRIMNLGFDILYSPQITVRHKVATAARKSWRRYYYDTRNHIWLAIRNYRFMYGLRYVLSKLFTTFVYSALDGYLVYWLKAVKDSILGISEEIKNRNPISRSTEKRILRIRRNRPKLLHLVKERLGRKSFQI